MSSGAKIHFPVLGFHKSPLHLSAEYPRVLDLEECQISVALSQGQPCFCSRVVPISHRSSTRSRHRAIVVNIVIIIAGEVRSSSHRRRKRTQERSVRAQTLGTRWKGGSVRKDRYGGRYGWRHLCYGTRRRVGGGTSGGLGPEYIYTPNTELISSARYLPTRTRSPGAMSEDNESIHEEFTRPPKTQSRGKKGRLSLMVQLEVRTSIVGIKIF